MTKTCKTCKQVKNCEEDFYKVKGTYRLVCKKCVIKRSMQYQKKNKTWRKTCVDEKKRREYFSKYYEKNRDKFREYGRKFRDKNPDYFRDYRIKKNHSKD